MGSNHERRSTKRTFIVYIKYLKIGFDLKGPYVNGTFNSLIKQNEGLKWFLTNGQVF